MIYSIIPEDAIYKAKLSVHPECMQHGALVQVESRGKQQVISRVIASNPQVYLKPELQPGTVIQQGIGVSL